MNVSFASHRVISFLQIGLLSAAIPLLSGVAPIEKFRTGVYDLKTHNITLHWKKSDDKPYLTLGAVWKMLEERGEKVMAAANAGIYGKDYAPLGLHIEDGVKLRNLNRGSGGGNFFLKPNGVFLIDAKGARILRTDRVKNTKGVKVATQSGPLLFDEKGLHPRFLKDSKSRYIRNAVGVRKDGSVVLAISRIPVTFWDLAMFMKNEMKCTRALYLDGSISRMRFRGAKSPQQFAPFVGILAVTEKRE